MNALPSIGVMPSLYIGTAKNSGWVSGTARSGRLLANRCVWVTETPVRGGGIGRRVRTITGTSRWSCRFLPTCGASRTTSIPSASRSAAGPIPLRNNTCGLSSAPAASTTSSAHASAS
ncbi:Uncharacterised protein [Mycobacteroides abscessus subsp. abscessus]|nr:Uncharacterised protein [Mycobacteroides abscessus subsp. abscessus]